MKSKLEYSIREYMRSRAPRGARGLKFIPAVLVNGTVQGSRAPRGARGLKYQPVLCLAQLNRVAPREGRVD